MKTNLFASSLLVLMAALSGACTITSTSTPASTGDVSNDDDAGASASSSYSNFDPTTISTDGAPDINDSDPSTIFTDLGRWTFKGETPSNINAVDVTLSDGSTAALFVVNSLTVHQVAVVTVKGARPAIIYSLGAVTISGTINVGASTGSDVADLYTGTGSGSGAASAGRLGAGGGSFCGAGGVAFGGAGAPQAGATYGNSALIPLVGGSQGGKSVASATPPTPAGGAIQITSDASITISSTGLITADGMYGSPGAGTGGGAGAGSGGAILLESPSIDIEGGLAANGGGGADTNNPGHAANGLNPAAESDSGGGSGSTALGIAANGGWGEGGGGGGGAGYITIKTSGTPTLNGTFSPAQSTSCTNVMTMGATTPPTN